MTSAQVQAALALILALGLHFGAFALRPAPAGATGSGAGGRDLLALQAAGPSLAAMVAVWDAPPQTPDLPVLSDPPAPAAPPPPPPPAPEASPSPTLPAMPSLPASATDVLPQIDTTATRPPAPAARPKPRPQPAADPAPERVPERAPEPTADRPERPAPAATGSTTAQTASGSGGGAVAGQGGQAEAPALSPGRAANLTAEWGGAIRSRIERRKRYPAAADGVSGTVTVRLTVTRGGVLTSVAVTASSGHPALDEAAIKAVRSAGRFPAAPRGLPEESYGFTLPMRFER